MDEVHFFQGENKKVRFRVETCSGQNFIIRDAAYTLARGGTPEAKGACQISGHIISAQLCPQHRGNYIYEISFGIGMETFIAKARVVVT